MFSTEASQLYITIIDLPEDAQGRVIGAGIIVVPGNVDVHFPP
jgi:hypothetical protein